MLLEYFGDPHAEAFHILCDSRVGMQARANQSWETLNPLGHDSNWYDILIRVMRCIFDVDLHRESHDVSDKECKTPNSELIHKLEEDFIVLLSKRIKIDHLTDEEQEILNNNSKTTVNDLIDNEKQQIIDDVTEQDRIIARGALSQLTSTTNALIQQRTRIKESKEGQKLLQEAQFFTDEAIVQANLEEDENDLDLEQSISHIKKMIRKNTGMNRDEVTSYAIQLGMQVAGVNKLSAALLVLRLSVQLIPLLAGVTLPIISLLGVFTTPIFFIGVAALFISTVKLAFGSTEGRLLYPVISILNQRLILAFEDIDIDDMLTNLE